MTQVLRPAHVPIVKSTFRPLAAPRTRAGVAPLAYANDEERPPLWERAPVSGHAPSHRETLTEYGIECFTAGDCWALAWHLYRLLQRRPETDPRLCVVGEWPGWSHVVVEIDTGLFLDATGLNTYDDLATSWGSDPVVHLPAEVGTGIDSYRRALSEDGQPYGFCYPIGHGETAKAAALVLAEHLPIRTAAAAA